MPNDFDDITDPLEKAVQGLPLTLAEQQDVEAAIQKANAPAKTGALKELFTLSTEERTSEATRSLKDSAYSRYTTTVKFPPMTDNDRMNFVARERLGFSAFAIRDNCQRLGATKAQITDVFVEIGQIAGATSEQLEQLKNWQQVLPAIEAEVKANPELGAIKRREQTVCDTSGKSFTAQLFAKKDQNPRTP